MIKARMTLGNGRTLLLVGLSRVNTEKLLAKQPIVMESTDFGLPDGGPLLMIVAGETEEEITKDFREFIGPETNVVDERGARDVR